MRGRLLRAAALTAIIAWSQPSLAQQQSQPPALPQTTAVTISIPLAGVPATIAGSGSWTSQCIQMSYYRTYTLFVALSAAGTIQTQQYADAACTLPVATLPASAQTLINGSPCPGTTYCGAYSSNARNPFLALKVTIADTSASTNTIVSTAFLPGAE